MSGIAAVPVWPDAVPRLAAAVGGHVVLDADDDPDATVGAVRGESHGRRQFVREAGSES